MKQNLSREQAFFFRQAQLCHQVLEDAGLCNSSREPELECIGLVLSVMIERKLGKKSRCDAYDHMLAHNFDGQLICTESTQRMVCCAAVLTTLISVKIRHVPPGGRDTWISFPMRYLACRYSGRQNSFTDLMGHPCWTKSRDAKHNLSAMLRPPARCVPTSSPNCLQAISNRNNFAIGIATPLIVAG